MFEALPQITRTVGRCYILVLRARFTVLPDREVLDLTVATSQPASPCGAAPTTPFIRVPRSRRPDPGCSVSSVRDRKMAVT